MQNTAQDHGSRTQARQARIVVDEVTKRIDDQVLLNPTSLTLHAGECLAVLGENGAGKTTLLRVLTGKYLPNEGEVRLDGERIDERSRRIREHIASLIGTPSFYPDLTVREQLRLIVTSWGLDADEGEQRIDDVLEAFGIDHLDARFIHELSSGQTQLFYLSTVFARPATVLVLDEPEQRLDPNRKQWLASAIERACAEGVSVVFTSHDPALVDRLAETRVTLESAPSASGAPGTVAPRGMDDDSEAEHLE